MLTRWYISVQSLFRACNTKKLGSCLYVYTRVLCVCRCSMCDTHVHMETDFIMCICYDLFDSRGACMYFIHVHTLHACRYGVMLACSAHVGVETYALHTYTCRYVYFRACFSPHRSALGPSHASVTIICRYDSWSSESTPTSGAALWELLSSHWTGYKQGESRESQTRLRTDVTVTSSPERFHSITAAGMKERTCFTPTRSILRKCLYQH